MTKAAGQSEISVGPILLVRTRRPTVLATRNGSLGSTTPGGLGSSCQRRAAPGRRLARGELAATKSYDPVFGTTTSATHIATVEIDPETFEIKVDRFAVAEDCGRLVNPLIVDGQVHGGVAQGIGAALYEEVIYDDQGQINTASLVDYLVPSACEIPPIQVVHLESESPTTLGGFRGMGEGGTIGSPAAIANAVSDALSPLGIDINELPITPERLFRLIEAARARGKT